MEIVVLIENYSSKVKGNYNIICEREKKTVFEKSCFQNTRLLSVVGFADCLFIEESNTGFAFRWSGLTISDPC